MKIKTIWMVRHFRKGKLIWESRIENSLANEGAEMVLEEFYRQNEGCAPTNFYVRLCNDTLLISDTLTTIQNEPSGNGYSPQTVEASIVGFPTKDIDPDGNWRLTSKTVTFTASGGNIGPITTAFLAT